MNTLRTPGGMLFALAVATLVFFVAAFLVKGDLFVEYGLIPGLLVFTRIALLASVVALPLALIRLTKPVARWTYFVSYLVFAVTVWVLGFLVTLQLWGVVGVIVGIAAAGAGVIATGVIAAGLAGAWTTVIELIVLSVLAYGTRVFALRLAKQLEPDLPVGRAEPVR
jgi:hypothetical protein